MITMQVTIIVTIPGKLATNPVHDENPTSTRQIRAIIKGAFSPRSWRSNKRQICLLLLIKG